MYSIWLVEWADELLQGLRPQEVGLVVSIDTALGIVSGYINQVKPEHLTATELAKVLGCRRPTIMKYLRAGRIPAIDVSTTGKPNYRFCLAEVKAALAVKKPASKSARKQQPTRPNLV